MRKCPLDVVASHRELPAVFATQAVEERRRRTEDIEPGANSECIRHSPGLPANLDLGLTIFLVDKRAHAETRIRREPQALRTRISSRANPR